MSFGCAKKARNVPFKNASVILTFSGDPHAAQDSNHEQKDTIPMQWTGGLLS
jgi:hypothetical protein